MKEFIFEIIEWASLGVGILGITTIIIGSISSFIFFLQNKKEKIHATLASHLILGLDFLIGKDVIDTLLIDNGEDFWLDLIGLITVVTIRIVLTYFLTKEIEQAEKKK